MSLITAYMELECRYAALEGDLEDLQERYDDVILKLKDAERNHHMKFTDTELMRKVKADAFMAGQVSCGVDPSWSEAVEYAEQGG